MTEYWQRTSFLLLVLLVTASHAAAADPLSPKRGFADVGAWYGSLQAVNAGWYYGWRPDKPSGVGNFDAEFLPMIWGGFQANQFEINRILGYGDVEWVLGFNEPERPDQANMSVGDAINAWRTLSNGFSGTNVKLVSPGVADTGGPDGGQAWLANFINQANAESLKVDAVAFHWYGVSNPNDPIGAANSFLSRVDSYHSSYGLPVWITEFGIIDWGNAYTDEEMRAANAAFVDYVVPRLDNRSYVEGYAFYQWTGDTTLIEGNPLAPTNIGVNYVGAIKQGDSYDLSGVDMGEHVAYLAGGELTHSGGAAGTVRYINALSNTSTFGGAGDWGMVEGNWIRVGTDASLRKTGANTITLDRNQITNNGVIEVAEGELILSRGPSVGGDGVMRVGNSGTLRFDGTSRYGSRNFNWRIELDGGVAVAPVGTVGLLALPGGEIHGHGTVSGGLTTLAGASVRVGGVGISQPGWTSIEDFESYSAGKLNAGASGGVWRGVFDGTDNAQIVTDGRNNALEYFGTGSSWRGAQTSLRDSFSAGDFSLSDGESATYFFRVQRQGSQTIDGIFGLTDQESIGIDTPWGELAITLSLLQDGNTPGTTALRAFNSGANTDVVIQDNIVANEWINVWLVVDNDAKTYQVATSTGLADGALFPAAFDFGRRSASGAALDTFAGAEFRSGSAPSGASVRIDDLVFLPGENLANPLSGQPPGLVLNPAELMIEGDFTASTGATLKLDLFDSTSFDRLLVTGVLTAGGLLQVSLDSESPDPQAGDSFDLFDFAQAVGTFDELLLPGLTAGLSWDVSQLYSNGTLLVVEGLPGDYNNDGLVDASDYAVWRENLGAPAGSLPNDIDGGVIGSDQYDTWKSNYGAMTSTASAQHAAPEPDAISIALFAALALGYVFRRTRCHGDRELLAPLAFISPQSQSGI